MPRTAASSSPMRSTRCARSRAGASSTRRGTWRASPARSPSSPSRSRCRPAAWSRVLRETVRRNRVRDGLVYLQVSRGAGPRNFLFPPAGTRAHRGLPRPQRLAGAAGGGGRGRHRRQDHARPALGPLRHQDGDAAARGARQGGGARRRRQGGLVRRCRRLRHGRRLLQRLDRGQPGPARHPARRQPHPEGHHPHHPDRRAEEGGRASSSSGPSRWRRPGPRARPSSPRPPTSSCRWCASTARPSATARRASSHKGCGPNFTRSAELAGP